jgi:hypothetical protein
LNCSLPKQGSREAGKQGSREAGKQGSREAGKQGSREAGKQGSREAGKEFNDWWRGKVEGLDVIALAFKFLRGLHGS